MNNFNGLAAYANRAKTGVVDKPGTYQADVNVNASKIGSSDGLKDTAAIEPSFIKKGEKATKLAESVINKYLSLLESSSLSADSGKVTSQTFKGKNAFFNFDQNKTSVPVSVKLKSNKSK